MKILNLELKAFGLFTDRVLDLSAGREGLHIIYGVNEAGKSTALRGVEQLFFGMPERTGDDFLHPSLSMRLGATLRHSDGGELRFWRRRARKVPLFAADDRTPLDACMLIRFLGKLDQGLFASMFGLNRATLEKAGQELLRGGGQLGQVLFAAASGIADLRQVQAKLAEELDELFKPTGRVPRINQALSELKETRERLKQHQLPSDDWLRHAQALRQAEENRQEVQTALDRVAREERRLTRLRDASPVLGRRRELLAELEPLRKVPRLPADFADHRRHAHAMLGSAAWKITESQRGLEDLDRQLATLEVPLDLLSCAEAIEELYQRLGEQQKAVRDLPEVQRRHEQMDAEVRQAWKNLGRGDAMNGNDVPRLRPDELAQIRKLALEYQSLRANLNNAQAGADRLTKFIDHARQALERLAAPLDVAELRRAVRQAQLQGPLEEEWTTLCRKTEQAEKHTAQLLEQLPRFSRPLEDLLTLSVPSSEVLDRFQEHFQDAHSRCQDAERKVRVGASELQQLAAQLHHLEKDQRIPTEEDLHEARRQRDRDWERVRQVWLEGCQEDQASLAESFSQSLLRADQVADHLRGEADRVAHKAELLGQAEQRRQLQEEQVQESIQAQARWQEVQREWRTLLESLGIPPVPPRAMRAWQARYHGIKQQALQANEFRGRADALRVRLDQQCRHLEECLEKLEGPSEPLLRSLTFLVDIGQQLLDRQETLTRRRQDLERDIAGKKDELEQARADLTQARDELKRWHTHWSVAMVRVGLPPTTPVDTAATYLESLQDFFAKAQELTSLHTRSDSLRHDLDGFARDVRIVQLAAEGRPDDSDPARTVVDLHRRLKRARESQQRQAALLESRQSLLAQLRQAEQTRGEQEVVQRELCRQAQCRRTEELAAAEEHSSRRTNLEAELARLDQHLQALRDGVPLDEFSREVAQVPVERLEADLAGLTTRREDLASDLKEVDQTIGRERKVLADMDGSALAADDAVQAEFLLAQLQADVREYAIRRLALGILQESIDRYRHKSEGQVVKRASDLFSLLTGGAFDGLNLDTNEQGETVLSGVRAGDRHMVMLDGMSDGTRDQLFLALRLASLEVYLDSHEPIPFIADDLLLNFDDTRAVAALKALAQLARRTQVLFFTHHQHLVDLARQALAPDVVFFHTLPEWKKEPERPFADVACQPALLSF